MKKSRGHLLLRVFFTYLLTAMLILGVVGFLFFSISPEKKLPPALESNFKAYLQMLQTKINADLTPSGIEKINNELGLKVRIETYNQLADQQSLPSFDEINQQTAKTHLLTNHLQTTNLQFGRIKGFWFASLRDLKPQTVWFLPLDHLPERFRFTFFGIAIVLISILAMSFLTIRWMMSPIRTLLEGVEHLSRGNLKFRINSNDCKNEFEVISAAFNRMATRLENMVNAKESLLRDVSHELRSPLTRINVASDLLEDEKMKNQIKSDVQKMDQLINEVLETYRIRDESFRIQLVEIDLKEYLELIIADYQDASTKVALIAPVEQQLKWKIDPLYFERVIRNLIENAIKYSDSNKILLKVEISLPKQKPLAQLKIEVIDYGKGLAEAELVHIFEPFYRVDRARSPNQSSNNEGYGLGLAISKAIIEAHQGSIRVTSQLGSGCTFTILLTEQIS